MSYGMFTVLRTELKDPTELRRKLELATGDAAAAARLTEDLLQDASAEPRTESWHIVPDGGSDTPRQWRAQPIAER
jgi:hypothetical protein